MEIQLVATVITVIFNTYLALLVIVRNPKSWTNRLYLILAFFVDLYLIDNYISLFPPVNTPQIQLLWIRIVMSGGAFLGPSLYLLVDTFPGDKFKMKRKFLIPILILAFITCVISLTPLVFQSIEYPNGKPVPIPGPGAPIFGLDFAGLFLFSFIRLIYKYRKSTGIVKVQHLYFLWGIILTFTVMAVSTFLFVVLLQNSDFVFFGPIAILLMGAFIAYSIVRHRFLDIRLVIARTLAFATLVLIIGGFMSLAFFVVGAMIFGIAFDLRSIIFYALSSFVVALGFQSVRRGVEQVTDKIFYKGKYDSDQFLAKIGHITSTDLELESLTQDLLQILVNELRIAGAALVLLEENSIYKITSLGFADNFDQTYNRILPLLQSEKTQIFDELQDLTLKDLMRQLNIALAKSLSVNDKLVGLLVLREKASGEVYSEGDIKVIEIITPEIAVAIQNSQSVDKIKRFNITLREEVDRATRQLRVANAKLEELDKLKDDFVSVASHELRTPMTAIRSYAWMALNKSDVPLSEKMKKYLSRTLISTERLINLVNEMLNISRIESGRVEVRPEAFNIIDLAKDVFDEVSVKAGEKKINLKLHDEVAQPKVFADKDKVHQVLLNLVGNSLKFTPENGVIDVDFASNNAVVGVAVKDNGAGIAKDDLAKLFKKFGRLDNSYVTAGTTGGTGLGLYVCKSLVQIMGGEIWVDSKGVNQGSTFYFTLPIASEEILAHPEKYQVKPQGEVKGLEPVTI
jgi:signal transduction histidine kinase